MILSLSSIATIINIITFLKLASDMVWYYLYNNLFLQQTLSADALSASRNKKNLRMLIQVNSSVANSQFTQYRALSKIYYMSSTCYLECMLFICPKLSGISSS